MRGSVGPWGLSYLIFFALVALALALIGWHLRNGAVVPPLPSFQSLTAFYRVAGGITG